MRLAKMRLWKSLSVVARRMTSTCIRLLSANKLVCALLIKKMPPSRSRRMRSSGSERRRRSDKRRRKKLVNVSKKRSGRRSAKSARSVGGKRGKSARRNERRSVSVNVSARRSWRKSVRSEENDVDVKTKSVVAMMIHEIVQGREIGRVRGGVAMLPENVRDVDRLIFTEDDGTAMIAAVRCSMRARKI
jgi:hypothetical protein